MSFKTLFYWSLGLAVGAHVPAATAVAFNLTHFNGALEDGTGVLRSLSPTSNSTFDFSPSDVWSNMTGDWHYHTGDLNLRWKSSDGRWKDGSTALNRSVEIKDLDVSSPDILSSDISAAFSGSGVQVIRTWTEYGGDLVLSFHVSNPTQESICIGGLGLPFKVNNVFTGRKAIDTINTCSFAEPYIGLDAGFVQVTSLTGIGPNMIAIPFSSDTKLEAWNYLQQNTSTDLHYQTAAYEGNFAWEVYTAGYKNSYWAGAEQWNEPTSLLLGSGDSRRFALRFTPVDAVEDIEPTLGMLGRPVAVGLPGYVLPSDVLGSLYLNSSLGQPTMDVYPRGSLTLGDLSQPPAKPWCGYSVTPTQDFFGRARITIRYPDMVQTVHYWVSDPAPTAIDKLGKFVTDKQWYTNTEDPFNRAPSFMTFDHGVDDFVLQDGRNWISGLSDEAGVGPWLALAIKQMISPNANEVKLLDTMVNETIWGTLQISSGNETYGVRRCLFYYQPEERPFYFYSPEYVFASFADSNFCHQVDRTFNYVHVSIVYWSLYKVHRISPNVTTIQEPIWYLKQAYETINFMFSNDSMGVPRTSSTQQGLMGESLWGTLVQDLRNEGMSDEADHVLDIQKRRQLYWASQPAPYGSEQPWDCTAQEGVYYWSKYFNDTSTALKTVDSVHGYDHAIPHWGYNGNARRYWDFGTAGDYKYNRIERQIHHYGSPFNAVPLLDWYRNSPTPEAAADFRNLRIGYAGHQASLSNIGADGFGSMSFHAWPVTLKWDNYTGDYGSSLVGHYLTSCSFLANHPDFGWHAFGGNLDASNNDSLTVTLTSALARRIFLADLGLDVQFEGGRISSYSYNAQSGELGVEISSEGLSETIMTFDVPRGNGNVTLQEQLGQSRGGFAIPFYQGWGSVHFSRG